MSLVHRVAGLRSGLALTMFLVCSVGAAQRMQRTRSLVPPIPEKPVPVTAAQEAPLPDPLGSVSLGPLPANAPDTSEAQPGEADEPDVLDAQPGQADAPETTDAQPRQTDVVRERYPDGRIKIQREVALDDQRNYVNHGTYRMFDPRGRTIAEGRYCMGKRHGRWVRHLAAGQGGQLSGILDRRFGGSFLSEATFVDGKLHGTWTITSAATNRKVIEWQFDSGVRHGTATWWHPNGQTWRVVTFKKGVPDGDSLEWGQDKKLAGQTTFIDGRELSTKVDWYARGKKKYEGSYLLARQPQPDFDWWNATAETPRAEKTGPDQKHGPWTAWYSNGQKQAEGRYEKDVPVGKFTWWHSNGQKEAEGLYAAGVQEGTWITWHRNGMKETEAVYEGGVLKGRLLRWEADGKLAEIQEFPSPDSPEIQDAMTPINTSINPARITRLPRIPEISSAPEESFP